MGRPPYENATTIWQQVHVVAWGKGARRAHRAGEGADVLEHVGHWQQAFSLPPLPDLQRALVNVQRRQARGRLSTIGASFRLCGVCVCVSNLATAVLLQSNCDHLVELQLLIGSLMLVIGMEPSSHHPAPLQGTSRVCRRAAQRC